MSTSDDIELVESAPYFDPRWYVARYPDVSRSGMSPAEHFVRIGSRIGRDPGPDFSTSSYLYAHPDVARRGGDALLHFIRYGRLEGRETFRSSAVSSGWQSPQEVRSSAVAPDETLVDRSGHLAPDPSRPTVLACAHLAGTTLFGGERSFLDLLDGFAAIGFDVVALLPSSCSGAYLEAVRARATLVYAFGLPARSGDAPLVEAIVTRIEQLISSHRIDAVHVNTITLTEPLVAARRRGVPAVVHVREIPTHDPDLCRWLGRSAEAIVSSVVEKADFIVANSLATAACYPTNGRTFVVPNAIDFSAYGTASRGHGSVRVALVGSTVMKKGVYEFVDLARILEDQVDATFVVVGPKSLVTQRIFDAEGVRSPPSNLVFAGYSESPVTAMAQADIVVNLSTCGESFGRTVLEAMAARLPVVAYAWGAIPELVHDGLTGYLVPLGDVALAAHRIARLCRDPELRSSFGHAGRRLAEERWSTDALARALRSSYRVVLAGRERAHVRATT